MPGSLLWERKNNSTAIKKVCLGLLGLPWELYPQG
jgi:hypothetical protein